MPSRAGKRNRNTEFLKNTLKKMYEQDFDPIIKAVENALRMQDIADGKILKKEDIQGADNEDLSSLILNEFDMRKDCVTAWEKIGQYTSPKLKALALSGDVGVHESVSDLSDEELAEIASRGS